MSDEAPTWDEFARQLGINLVRARSKAGLSQERVAQWAGIAAYTYHKFERGQSRPGSPMNPRLTTLIALSQALEIPLEELLPDRFPDALGRD